MPRAPRRVARRVAAGDGGPAQPGRSTIAEDQRRGLRRAARWRRRSRVPAGRDRGSEAPATAGSSGPSAVETTGRSGRAPSAGERGGDGRARFPRPARRHRSGAAASSADRAEVRASAQPIWSRVDGEQLPETTASRSPAGRPAEPAAAGQEPARRQWRDERVFEPLRADGEDGRAPRRGTRSAARPSASVSLVEHVEHDDLVPGRARVRHERRSRRGRP